MTTPIERDLDDLQVGDDVTAWFATGHGQGGVIQSIHDDTVTMLSGTARIHHTILVRDVHHWTRDEYLDATECLDYDPDTCSGPVDYRHSWPRCAFHGEKRLRDHENSIERYADSDVAPSWFDPADAGERWDDDY
jgi:hypothetical protein